jgi:hypothetical protein
MPSYLNKWSLSATWLLVLTVVLSIAAGTISLAAWIGLALIGLMPPAMLIVLSRAPEPTTSEVIRGVEAGRSI